MSCPASTHLDIDATATPNNRATVTVERVFLIVVLTQALLVPIRRRVIQTLYDKISERKLPSLYQKPQK